MARQGITRDQVFTAADALVGDGQQPTINAIRERLGGTGVAKHDPQASCAMA